MKAEIFEQFNRYSCTVAQNKMIYHRMLSRNEDAVAFEMENFKDFPQVLATLNQEINETRNRVF